MTLFPREKLQYVLEAVFEHKNNKFGFWNFLWGQKVIFLLDFRAGTE